MENKGRVHRELCFHVSKQTKAFQARKKQRGMENITTLLKQTKQRQL